MAVVYVDNKRKTRYLVDFDKCKIAPFSSLKSDSFQGESLENLEVTSYINYSFDSSLGQDILWKIYSQEIVQETYLELVMKEIKVRELSNTF